jgi:hypothetical protein
MNFEINAIWVNDEEKIYYMNAKYRNVEHKGCRKVKEDIQPRLKKYRNKLEEQGYKQVYADEFAKYRE